VIFFDIFDHIYYHGNPGAHTEICKEIWGSPILRETMEKYPEQTELDQLQLLARSKRKYREIAGITIKRAFATMTLSLFVIGICILLISVFENDFTLIQIAFECFSAYSTVGLTLGITFKLSMASKAVLIVLMFIGRVTMLSIMIAIFRKVKFTGYRYAKEELTIN